MGNKTRILQKRVAKLESVVTAILESFELDDARALDRWLRKRRGRGDGTVSIDDPYDLNRPPPWIDAQPPGVQRRVNQWLDTPVDVGAI